MLAHLFKNNLESFKCIVDFVLQAIVVSVAKYTLLIYIIGLQ